METVSKNYNIKINIGKTKVIACGTKAEKERLNIEIGNEKVLNSVKEKRNLNTSMKRRRDSLIEHT